MTQFKITMAARPLENLKTGMPPFCCRGGGNLGAASTTELDSDEEHGGTLKQNCSGAAE